MCLEGRLGLNNQNIAYDYMVLLRGDMLKTSFLRILKGKWSTTVRQLSQTYKVLFMVFGNHQLAAGKHPPRTN